MHAKEWRITMAKYGQCIFLIFRKKYVILDGTYLHMIYVRTMYML